MTADSGLSPSSAATPRQPTLTLAASAAAAETKALEAGLTAFRALGPTKQSEILKVLGTAPASDGNIETTITHFRDQRTNPIERAAEIETKTLKTNAAIEEWNKTHEKAPLPTITAQDTVWDRAAKRNALTDARIAEAEAAKKLTPPTPKATTQLRMPSSRIAAATARAKPK